MESDVTWRYTIEPQHEVANARMYGKDIDLVRKVVWEAMQGVGVQVRYFRCRQNDPDFYQDPDCQWDAPIEVCGIYEDQPKIKLIRDMGWYTEDDERPQIIYFPIYKDWTTKEIFDVKENSLIQVTYFGQTAPAEFRIMERKLDSVYGCYYICRLAPERLNEFTYAESPKGDYYLKKAVRLSDDCSHVLEQQEETAQNGGTAPDKRVFIHSDFDDYADLIMED